MTTERMWDSRDLPCYVMVIHVIICTYIHAGTHQVQRNIQEQASRDSSDDRNQVQTNTTSGMMGASLYIVDETCISFHFIVIL